MKYFISVIAIVIGMFITIKSEWMLRFFGYSEWAETKFGIWGGSRMMYKLTGIIIIIGAVMVMTGWLQDILLAIFRPERMSF